MFKWLLAWRKPSNRLWATPTIWALLTVGFVFALKLGAAVLPDNWLPDVPVETLSALLNIIASSMLAVSTFSLSIMVSAFASAANGVTPRATDVVMGDDNTRTAITSFICAFIYALIAKTALGMDFYEQNGRFILFISTVAVLVYLIVTLIRWVYTLSHLGRLGNTLRKIETVAECALTQYRMAPQMYATRKTSLPTNAQTILAECTGYLTHIDMQGLQEIAEENQWDIDILVRPGELITPDSELCKVSGNLEDVEALQRCFVLAPERTFEQDPSWGFIVLSEAAQRALSPAVNDPGTAINIMTIMLSLLVKPKENVTSDEPCYDRLSIKALDCKEWIRDGFAPISRDGATILEVNIVMQKVLAGVWRNAPENEVREAAKAMAISALQRSLQSMEFELDRSALSQKHQELFE
ncbi:MAG: DUF2254 family protein [Pasteurellaceae bacterium]|nr:DUF2254 family protein [Pasteurellaceae bacterium]